MVIYGKVVELLPDEVAKAGLKRTVEGSSLAECVWVPVPSDAE